MKDLHKVYASVWEDVREGRVLVVWDRWQDEFGTTSSAPLYAVPMCRVDGAL